MKLTRELITTLNTWQSQRPVWFILGLTPIVLDVLAWEVFQNIQGYLPCELCVYIRLSMFIIAIGSLIIAIKPTSAICRIIGYVMCVYGIVKGWFWNIALEWHYIMVDSIQNGTKDIFAYNGLISTCSLHPTFPLGLPLNEWFPSMFQPTGTCGADGWLLFGFNMSECLFLFYAAYTLAFLLLIGATIKDKFGRCS
ncbi:disulfide bond formation protein B [Deferribacterales bacterium RsTz2092]|nr:putative protein-disulfide oxidoreductase DsbI [Deferribacterales bacterium]